MSYLVFARKYRPRTFEEMIGQNAVVQTLQNAVRNGRVAQAYLFSGMRGVGKTTAARILAKALNCKEGPTPTPCNRCEFCEEINQDKSLDVIEIDGASNTSVDEVRTLREGVQYKPIHCRSKVIIIDEIHMLSKSAFNALLKTLEEPPPNTVFIFATTEFHKVPATIVSRCQSFEFKRITHSDIFRHLRDLAGKEGIRISDVGLQKIAEAAEGSLRDAQSLLDQAVAFSGEEVKDEDLKDILGTVNREILFQFSSAVLEEKPERIFELVELVIDAGYDLRYFHEELIRFFRDLLLARTVEDIRDLLPYEEADLKKYRDEAGKAGADEWLRYLDGLQQGEELLRRSSHPRIAFEALLIKLTHYREMVPLAELIERVQFPSAAEGTEPEAADPGPAKKPGAVPSSQRSPERVMNRGGATEEEARNSSNGRPAPLPSDPPARSRETTNPRSTNEVSGEIGNPKSESNPADPPKRRARPADRALQDPSFQAAMDILKAQIVSVEENQEPTEASPAVKKGENRS